MPKFPFGKGGAPAAASEQYTALEPNAKKKATFTVNDKEEASKKIQAISRGKLARQSTSAKLELHKAQGKSPPGSGSMRLSRRVSYGGSSAAGSGPSLLEAIRKCLLQNGINDSCLPDGVAPVPTVSTASSDDFQAAAAAAAKRKAESDAAAAAKAAVKISPALVAKVEELFKKIDFDANGTITKDEAQRFWGKNWAKVNAQAMFNEVDKDENDEIDHEEWLEFWRNVVASGYPEDDVLEELTEIINHQSSWVDFEDGRTT